MRRETAKRDWRASKIDAYEANRALREAKRRADEAAVDAADARAALRAEISGNVRGKLEQPIDMNTTHEAFEARREELKEQREKQHAARGR